jgi:hypothetical protein
MRSRFFARAGTAAALVGLVFGLVSLQPASAAPAVSTAPAAPTQAPIVIDWAANVESQVGALINAPVAFPEGRFTGQADLAAGSVEGDFELPAGRLEFWALGLLPMSVEVTVEPTGPVSGTLDSSLALDVQMGFDIVLTNMTLVGLPVLDPAQECRTTAPIEADLTGQVNPTLTGATLTGTYAIPALAGCGWMEGLINMFTVGSNNTLEATIGTV